MSSSPGCVVRASEIDEHGAAGRVAVLEHDVARLHIAVNEPRRVDRRECRRDVAPDAQHFCLRERPRRGELLFQRVTEQAFGPDAGASIEHVGAVYREHVGMPDARQVARLVEPAQCAGLGPAQFECDLAVQRRVPRFVHFAERARAEEPAHFQCAPQEQRLGCPFLLVGRRRAEQARETIDEPHPFGSRHRRRRAAIGDRGGIVDQAIICHGRR